jgi:hypothetical protein
MENIEFVVELDRPRMVDGDPQERRMAFLRRSSRRASFRTYCLEET